MNVFLIVICFFAGMCYEYSTQARTSPSRTLSERARVYHGKLINILETHLYTAYNLMRLVVVSLYDTVRPESCFKSLVNEVGSNEDKWWRYWIRLMENRQS